MEYVTVAIGMINPIRRHTTRDQLPDAHWQQRIKPPPATLHHSVQHPADDESVTGTGFLPAIGIGVVVADSGR